VREASLTLPAELKSVGQARRFLRDVLQEWNLDGFELAAPQVLTELATNAALHARSAYTVHLLVEPDAVLIEVSDSSPALPQARHYGTGATTGRGIALVEALSAAWGVESSPTGKTVWCRVRSDDQLPDFLDDDDVVADGKVAKVTPITGHPEAGGRHGVALAHAA
jgi:anti-sigma regulatory factor (Ser/Thr protein kinase)